MKGMRRLFEYHQAKVWLLAAAVAGVLVMNVAAAKDEPPIQWEYKTVCFKVQVGDNVARLQNEFDITLNREATAGWEYAGRCAHLTGAHYGIDYVAFRRPRRY